MLKRVLLTIMLLVFTSSVALAATVTLRWDRNNEPDLAKYTLYWRAPGDTYTRVATPQRYTDIDVDVVNSEIMSEHPNEVTVNPPGTEWEFVVTASDNSGNESDYSNQVDIIKPQPPGGLTIWEVIYAWIKSFFSWLT